MRAVDFLIIGQGLAGSLLAYALIKRGKSVQVLDASHQGSSTQVAAGLINPITGHRLNITERFFEYAKAAKNLYWQLERDMACSVYRDLPQTRLIKNQGQYDYLCKRKQQKDYEPLFDSIDETGHWFADKSRFEHGAINVSQTAVVNTKVLLSACKAWLKERDALIQQRFDYASIQTTENGVAYETPNLKLQANGVIFCEGYQAINNPWLRELPFKLAKGEILTLNIEPKDATKLDRMLSWGKWLVPTASSRAKIGANYIWNNTDLSPSPDIAQQYCEELKRMTDLNADVSAHEVGIRPTTAQRKPFVGPLSQLRHAYCLNGMGSKGCLIAPHYVNLLCDHLCLDRPLPEENTQWL